jgi:hypothetical protein
MPSPEVGIPAGASLLGGLLSSQGQQAAASTSADAANRAIELQDRQRQAEIARLQPQFEAGTNALRQMQGGAFAQPEAFRFGAGDYQADPGYAFRLAEGQKALDRQAAARGGLISGSALKAAQRYGQDMGSQEYGNAYNRALTGYNANVARSDTGYNRLAAMAGLGQTAGTQIGAAGQNYATNAGNLMGQAGQATAAGQLGMGNTFNNALGTIASGYQNQSNFDRFLASQRRPSLYDAPRYDYTPYNANTMIPMQEGGGY